MMRNVKVLVAVIFLTLVGVLSNTVYAKNINIVDITQPKWDQINSYSEGMAAVMEKTTKIGTDGNAVSTEMWGFIDECGKVIVKPQYRAVGDFHEGVAWVRGFGVYDLKVINKNGKIILDANKLSKNTYDSATDCSNGVVGFRVELPYAEIGYYDLSGKYIAGWSTKFQDGASIMSGCQFTENVGCVRISTKEGMRAGYVDKKGKLTYFNKGITESGCFYQGYAMAFDDIKKKWGIIDKTSKWIVAPQYDEWLVDQKYGQQMFSKEGIAVLKKNGKWGAIDKKGKTIIEFKHNYLSFFEKGYCVYQVNKNGKYGIYNSKGKAVVAPKYDGIFSASTEGMILVLSGNKSGYIDITGKEVIKPRYQKVSNFYKKTAIVCENNQYYWIDTKGNKIRKINKDLGTIKPMTLFFIENNGMMQYDKKDKVGIIKIV